QLRHQLRILRGEARQSLRGLDRAAETGVVGHVGGYRRPALAYRRGHRDRAVGDAARGGDLGAGKAGVASPSAGDTDPGLVGAAHRQRALGQRARLLAREKRYRVLKERARHQRVLAVLITLTCRKRAGGQPWLTEFDCPGWPLPSP